MPKRAAKSGVIIEQEKDPYLWDEIPPTPYDLAMRELKRRQALGQPGYLVIIGYDLLVRP